LTVSSGPPEKPLPPPRKLDEIAAAEEVVAAYLLGFIQKLDCR
jgi:hypothetical protein